MDDFIYRTVTAKDTTISEAGDKVIMSVSRTRNSNGFASIVADFNGQRIEFNCRDRYEQDVRRFAELLIEVCENPCALPRHNID